MQLISIISATGLAALTTNAFLLPPDISDADNDIVSTLPVPVPVIEGHPEIPKTAEAQTLEVKCPGCPVRIPHHSRVKVVHDIPSHIELNFSIKTSDGADRLMLNGFELYPKVDIFQETLTADVIPNFVHREAKRPTHFKGPRPQLTQNLGFGVVSRVAATNADDLLELVEIEFRIIEVGGDFFNNLPKVQIKLVKTPTGKLMMAGLEALESETTATIQSNPMDKQEECTTLLCKWRSIVSQKLSGLRFHKGCGGRHRHSKGQGHDHTKSEDWKSKPLTASQWDGHREHHQKNWGLLFKNIASHILLPVAIGILAGITASV